MTSHLLLIIASILVIGELSYGVDPDYIRLDLSPLRGGDVPSNTKAYPRRIPVESPAEELAIFCTDGDYPNDIFCDIRSYFERRWKNRSLNIYEVVIKYPHPERGDVACEVNFEKVQAEEYPLLRLPYSRFSCSPSFNDTELPVFQLTEASRLIIKLYFPGSHCHIIFNNNGRVTKSLPEVRRVSVIKFEYYKHVCPRTSFDGRRTVERGCVNDGRRCRPVNE